MTKKFRMTRRTSGCSPEIHPEASGISTARIPDVLAESTRNGLRQTSGCVQIIPEELARFWSSGFAIKPNSEQKHVAANPDDQPY